MRVPSLDKVVFVLSAALLVWFHGFATSVRHWFPNDLIVEGWHQFQAVQGALWGDDHPALRPRVFDRHGARRVDSLGGRPGLTLVPSVWKGFGWEPGLQLIDRTGRVLHEWRVDPADIFPGRFTLTGPFAGLNQFHEPLNAYLFPNGDVLVLVGNTGTARLDACGRVEWRIEGVHHHSLTRAEDGTFWVSSNESERQPDPLHEQESVLDHLLVQFSEHGEVIRKIRVFDILLENEELARRHLRFQTDDTHLNDVEPLPASLEEEYPLFDAGDLLVSLKHLNLVFVVDPQSLEVKWWAGEPFILQHDPDFVGDGWIGVFDNRYDGTERGTRLGGSRVLAFRPHTDSMTVWFESSEANRVYTSGRGNWQLLESGNLLITESETGRVVEVKRDGRLAWEWIQEPYDGDRVFRLSRAKRYHLSPGKVATWPCSPSDSVESGALSS